MICEVVHVKVANLNRKSRVPRKTLLLSNFKSTISFNYAMEGNILYQRNGSFTAIC